jgi:hypothetical protein
LQSIDTKSRAEQDHIGHGGAGSPGKGRRNRRSDLRLDTYPSEAPTYSLNSPDISSAAGPSAGPGTLMQALNLSGTPLGSVLPSPSLSPAMFSLPIPFVESPHYPGSLPGSSGPSQHGSPASFSQPSLPHTCNFSNPAIHRRPSSRFSATVDALPWSSAQQKNFENCIACLTASAGLPLSWVDNAEFVAFIGEFSPAAKSPSRKVLTRRLIPAAVAEFRAEAKAAANGHEATIKADGWTGVNHHHLIAFMIMVDGKVSQHL